MASTAPSQHLIWGHHIASDPPPPTSWLWHGFLAGGSLTLLTGLWKAGKTTLVSHLLARRKQGGTLAGLEVKPGKTLVVTEESIPAWADRIRKGDYGNQVCFLSRPFLAAPKPDEWRAFVERIVHARDAYGIDLLVLDPLAPLLQNENNPSLLLQALQPLALLTSRGMAVLALHHPTKKHAPVGQAARGTGALVAHVDVSIEMRHPGGDPLTRRRRLVALSRYSETPRELLIELNSEGNDYAVVTGESEDGFAANWNVLRMIFEEAPQKLTRDDILLEWPADYDAPCRRTLRIWLSRALEMGRVLCQGTGRKSDPFRYWTPEREAVWKDDPLYDIKHELPEKYRFVSLSEKRRNDREAGRFADEGFDDE